MNNLTTLQQSLIDGLINEFTKINPKPNNGTKRFSFDTIAECQKEEERFLTTIKKHNQTMVKVFEKQLADEFKAFTKEFGKTFTLQLGYKSGTSTYNDLDKLIDVNKNDDVKRNHNSSEMHLFIVSKTKTYYDGSSTRSEGYCNGKQYHRLYVDFKRERVDVILESGKQVIAYKIGGLVFKSNDYLREDVSDFIKTSTFDEFIQTSKTTQRKLVEMAS
jgi:hypothetical protein